MASCMFLHFLFFKDLVCCSAWIFWHLLLLFLNTALKYGLSWLLSSLASLYILCLNQAPFLPHPNPSLDGMRRWKSYCICRWLKWDQTTFYITSLWGLSFHISSMGPITPWFAMELPELCPMRYFGCKSVGENSEVLSLYKELLLHFYQRYKGTLLSKWSNSVASSTQVWGELQNTCPIYSERAAVCYRNRFCLRRAIRTDSQFAL